jgi:hypothetical protein
VAVLVMRFYGRFVIADKGSGGANGRLHVLALNMAFNKGVPTDPHRLLLAAPRLNVVATTTTLPIDMIVMQPGAEPDLAEVAVWEIGGMRLTPRVSGGFRWNAPPTKVKGSAPTPALADLGALSTLPFDQEHTQKFGDDRPVRAIVDINAGFGKVGLIDPAPAQFLAFKNATTANAEAAGPFDELLAEFVDVTVRLPEKTRQLEIDVLARDGSSQMITLQTDSTVPTMVTFSNVCAAAHDRVDKEFAAAYEVLKKPPVVADRKVPVTIDTGGHLNPCFKSAFIAF